MSSVLYDLHIRLLQGINDPASDFQDGRFAFLFRWCPQRLGMGIMLFFATVIVYALRVNLSVAIITMNEEYVWSDLTKGMILSSFFWGYITSQGEFSIRI